MIHHYYLGLGSNLGDRLGHLRRASIFLRTLGRVTARSAVYETVPENMTGAGNFLNMAAALESELEPETLLDAIKAHERECGRCLTDVLCSRPIDIDILLDGDRIYSSLRLTIPHPRLLGRRFALAPLADIAPQLIHPGVGRSIGALLADMQNDKWGNRFGELDG